MEESELNRFTSNLFRLAMVGWVNLFSIVPKSKYGNSRVTA